MRKGAVMQYDSTEERTITRGDTCQSGRASSRRRGGGPTPIITQTNPEDILCGKEKHCIIHDGTRRYRKFIDAFQPRYNAATTKQEKMEITKEIVTTLGRTARFLRYNKELDAYEELSHLEARDKTSHALRTACKRISKQQMKLTSASASPLIAMAAAAPAHHHAAAAAAKPAAVLSTPLVLDAASNSGVTGTNTTPNHRQWQSSSHHHHHQRQSSSSNERYHHQRARFPNRGTVDHHHPLPIHSNQQMDGALFDDLLTLLKDTENPVAEESE